MWRPWPAVPARRARCVLRPPPVTCSDRSVVELNGAFGAAMTPTVSPGGGGRVREARPPAVCRAHLVSDPRLADGAEAESRSGISTVGRRGRAVKRGIRFRRRSVEGSTGAAFHTGCFVVSPWEEISAVVVGPVDPVHNHMKLLVAAGLRMCTGRWTGLWTGVVGCGRRKVVPPSSPCCPQMRRVIPIVVHRCANSSPESHAHPDSLRTAARRCPRRARITGGAAVSAREEPATALRAWTAA